MAEWCIVWILWIGSTSIGAFPNEAGCEEAVQIVGGDCKMNEPIECRELCALFKFKTE